MSEPDELWRAELGGGIGWSATRRRLLRGGDDEGVVLGAVALLALDAQRTTRALESAAHGRRASTWWSWSVALA